MEKTLRNKALKIQEEIIDQLLRMFTFTVLILSKKYVFFLNGKKYLTRSFIIYANDVICYSDQIKKDGMEGTWNIQKMLTKVWLRNLNKGDHMKG
jgi:hypothetical protein